MKSHISKKEKRKKRREEKEKRRKKKEERRKDRKKQKIEEKKSRKDEKSKEEDIRNENEAKRIHEERDWPSRRVSHGWIEMNWKNLLFESERFEYVAYLTFVNRMYGFAWVIFKSRIDSR